MKKAAILTLHFYDNYGSVLQAYALKRAVESCGYGASIIPYRPDCLPEHVYFNDSELLERYGQRRDKFRQFRAKCLGVVSENICDIKSFIYGYDTYIVGSDIVWGREFSGLDTAYFLDFAPDNAKKIAYAASVILNNLGNTEDDSLFQKHLNNFNALSVREASSVSALQKFSDREISAVIDPALLFSADDYEEILINPLELPKEPYLLSYFLTHDPAAIDFTNMAAKKFGLKVVHYFADYPKRIFDEDAQCFAFCGPGEFLAYVKNASMVLTNSYHGTIFSIIFSRPFYTYAPRAGMRSRVADLTEALGLEERRFYAYYDLRRMTDCCDFTKVHKKLNDAAVDSMAFLSKALG